MTRIATRPVLPKQPSLRFTARERRYYRWLHENGSCCMTGQRPFELAHTGGLAQGKGMGRKAAIWTVLPLIRDLHIAEERGRFEFWRNAGFPDHLDWAIRLYDIFEAKGDPASLLLDMQDRANRTFLLSIMKGKT